MQIFVKSKTQSPELIFVVLNFVAIDDCTHHAPFAIEREPSSDCHQSDRNREISSLIPCSIVESTGHQDHVHVHTCCIGNRDYSVGCSLAVD